MAFELNPKQKEAVYYDGVKPLLIEAGAGSGKTRVMTERVKYLLDRGEDPKSILVCTFSNKAANELKDRLLKYALDENNEVTKSDIQMMHISTVHSFCISLLKEKGYNFEVYDDDYNERRNLFIYKHRQELGFVNTAHISRGQVNDIAEKFSEYLEFEVDCEGLENYIKENFPIKENYIKFIEENCINDNFPSDEIYKDKDLKEDGEGYFDSWYNARYLQTIKAFPIYIKLLEKHNATNFAHIQSKALEILKNDNKTQYKHILVDEFQDTDPIQIQIFEILMNEAIKDNVEVDENINTNSKNSNIVKGTFTAVGDMNQNIYGFRGAVKDYFKEFDENYDCKLVSIDYNYRSSNQIVKLSEELIKNQRKSYSNNESIKASKSLSKDSYYIQSDDANTEAHNISVIINYLVNNDKADYNDILILFRSVVHHSKELIEEFNSREIPYHIRGSGKLEDNDEIKSILTLLDFLVQNTPSNESIQSDSLNSNNINSKYDSNVPVHGSWDFLGINGFIGADFNPIWNLSDETKRILANIQQSYENQVLEVGKRVQKAMGAKNRRTFKTMFKHDKEVLEEIFKEVKEPVLTVEFLKSVGVNDEKDLEFFNKLNKLKNNFFNVDYAERDSILTVYYKLLDICGYFNEEFVKNPKNKNTLENIALLTNTIVNYENIISNSDIRGFYWYLSSNLKNYSSPSIDSEGVQIMTVHEAKGLEYPITILASLREDKFPKIYEDPQEAHRGKEPYYAPNRFFKYKLKHEEEEKAHIEEEIRIIYVGMTRAEDTLILSSIPKSKSGPIGNSMPQELIRVINNNSDLIKDLEMDDLDVIGKILESKEIEKDNKLNLSYSSLHRYTSCPLSYHLMNDIGFRIPSNTAINYGNIVHNALEVINNHFKEGKTLSDDEIILLVSKIHDNYPNMICDPFEKQRVIENVLYYVHNYADKFKVLESEYEFSIYEKDYTLNGAIDLVFETEDGNLGIIDYKNYNRMSKEELNKFKEQINIYILALKNDPNYSDKEITQAFIYGTKLRKLVPIDLNELNQENTINELSKEIKSDDFENKINKQCERCTFNFICLKKRCPICGKPILDNMELCRECRNKK